MIKVMDCFVRGEAPSQQSMARKLGHLRPHLQYMQFYGAGVSSDSVTMLDEDYFQKVCHGSYQNDKK